MADMTWRSPVTTVSTDLEALVEGGTNYAGLGSLRREEGGNVYRLFKGSGVITALTACEMSGMDAITKIPLVIEYATAGTVPCCVYPGTVDTVTLQYFWGQVAGTLDMTEGASNTTGAQMEFDANGNPIDFNTGIACGYIVNDNAPGSYVYLQLGAG